MSTPPLESENHTRHGFTNAVVQAFLQSNLALVLTWWRTELLGGVLLPNPDEVAEAHWMTPSQIESLPTVLASNRKFLRLHAGT